MNNNDDEQLKKQTNERKILEEVFGKEEGKKRKDILLKELNAKNRQIYNETASYHGKIISKEDNNFSLALDAINRSLNEPRKSNMETYHNPASQIMELTPRFENILRLVLAARNRSVRKAIYDWRVGRLPRFDLEELPSSYSDLSSDGKRAIDIPDLQYCIKVDEDGSITQARLDFHCSPEEDKKYNELSKKENLTEKESKELKEIEDSRAARNIVSTELTREITSKFNDWLIGQGYFIGPFEPELQKCRIFSRDLLGRESGDWIIDNAKVQKLYPNPDDTEEIDGLLLPKVGSVVPGHVLDKNTFEELRKSENNPENSLGEFFKDRLFDLTVFEDVSENKDQQSPSFR